MTAMSAGADGSRNGSSGLSILLFHYYYSKHDHFVSIVMISVEIGESDVAASVADKDDDVVVFVSLESM